jgi:cysteine desulfurase
MRIYLDYNATAPLRDVAREAMCAVMGGEVGDVCGNPSSIHWAGRAARNIIEAARAEVASLIGAAPRDLIFTSGGTESNNLAIRGAARRGRHIVTTAIEHASVLEPCDSLALAGSEVTHVGVDRLGRVAAAAVMAALRPDTALVSVGLANNEVGTVQPVLEIARSLAGRRIPLHVDAVQAVGKIPVAVDELQVDLMSISAHKLGGPPGVGALYVRRGCELVPQLAGGTQELGRRAGTENVIGIAGFGAAARACNDGLDGETARQRELLARAWAGIQAQVPDVERNTPEDAGDGAVPNTLSLSFPGADADALVIGLDLCGIAVSAGSACAAGSLEPSHVLLAMGRSPAAARAALRISVGYGTTEAEIDTLLTKVPDVVARSRRTNIEDIAEAG